MCEGRVSGARWSFLSSVAPVSRRLGPQGQEGSLLILVIAVVLVLSIGVVSVLHMSLNADTVAVKLEDSDQNVHGADGALEKAVNDVRDDPAECTASMTYDSYGVECSGPGTAGNPTRVVDLLATRSGNVVGKARVRFTDKDNGQPLTGYMVEVCDWLLGGTMLSENLKGCS